MKAPRNKYINKKKNTIKYFLHQVLNSYNTGKSWFDHEEELWNFKSCSENASGRKIVIPEEDINYYDQDYYDYDQYMNEAAKAVKLNRHILMDVKILEKALSEIMASKIFDGSASILENRNCHKSAGTKLVLRCNNSRCTSEISFQSTYSWSESRKSYQISTLNTVGKRAIRKAINISLNLFAILNL